MRRSQSLGVRTSPRVVLTVNASEEAAAAWCYEHHLNWDRSDFLERNRARPIMLKRYINVVRRTSSTTFATRKRV